MLSCEADIAVISRFVNHMSRLSGLVRLLCWLISDYLHQPGGAGQGVNPSFVLSLVEQGHDYLPAPKTAWQQS